MSAGTGGGARVARDVALLVVDDCPNAAEARDRVRRAVGATGGDPDAVREVVVRDEAQARRLGFRGSPTVLVDGVDPFADRQAPTGVSCRLYATPEGLRGVPTAEQLVAALRA